MPVARSNSSRLLCIPAALANTAGPTGAMAHVYSRYLVKFFESYKLKHGIDFWALTAGNEPAGNTGAWQDLKFSAAEQRDFIKTALGQWHTV